VTAPTYRLTGDVAKGQAAALAEWLAANPGPVVVVINSPGGDAAEGAALMAEVERHGQVTVRVLGIAASAATLPMVAAHAVLIHPAALVMIHEPGAWAEGTADNHRAAAAVLDKMTMTYAQAYARHTGHPVQTILDWMQAETWMTADEAVALAGR
jgi:ATP-dependent Clp protease, protease subunit